MEFCDEVNDAAGKDNIHLLLEYTKNGKIKKTQIKDMALLMGVHGVFSENEKGNPLHSVVRLMLDEWFKIHLCKPGVDGFIALQNVLKDTNVGLQYLGYKMEPHKGMRMTSTHQALVDPIHPVLPAGPPAQAQVPPTPQLPAKGPPVQVQPTQSQPIQPQPAAGPPAQVEAAQPRTQEVRAHLQPAPHPLPAHPQPAPDWIHQPLSASPHQALVDQFSPILWQQNFQAGQEHTSSNNLLYSEEPMDEGLSDMDTEEHDGHTHREIMMSTGRLAFHRSYLGQTGRSGERTTTIQNRSVAMSHSYSGWKYNDHIVVSCGTASKMSKCGKDSPHVVLEGIGRYMLVEGLWYRGRQGFKKQQGDKYLLVKNRQKSLCSLDGKEPKPRSSKYGKNTRRSRFCQ